MSIVPREGGYRLLCNRDELLSRPLALPPRWTRRGDVSVAYPVDPARGGTWLAVNQHGLAVALLNRHAGSSRVTAGSTRRRLRSRGEIPLALADAGSLDEIRRRLHALEVSSYPPFLTVAVWFDRLVRAESDGAHLAVTDTCLLAPVAFTSSSLGDADAEEARLPLFRSLVGASRDPWAAQRAFHDHHWPARPDISVRMQRADARTMSRTRIDVKALSTVEGARVMLDYEPLSLLPGVPQRRT